MSQFRLSTPSTRISSICLLATLALTGSALAQPTVYALANGGSTLIRFPASNPSAVTVVGTFNGGNTFLDAIDFRPATNQLYGYLDSADSFYTIDLTTAQLTLSSVGASGAPTNTFQLGLDFNPTIDRARLVTDSDQNIVFNPNTGTAAAFTNLFYATGDVNEEADPNIIDNAYTQNFLGSVTSQQYVIDYELNSLARLANNAGTLNTVGLLGVDTSVYTGFDIFTSNGVDTAYAILTGTSGLPGFYTINLATGEASLVGALGAGGTDQVYSLAVIPSPAAGLALSLGLASFAGRRRR